MEADRSFSLKAVSIGQQSQMGGTFSPQWQWTEGESETAHSERLFIIFLDYTKMSGWIFTITGWLFSHTEATQLCSNLSILHNRSSLIWFKLEVLLILLFLFFTPSQPEFWVGGVARWLI